MLTSSGFPAHFIVDQGRSGVQNIRQAWGDWCNVLGAGFGTQPTTNTGSALIDSIVWVKPGGECDGTSNTSSPRYDPHCSLSWVWSQNRRQEIGWLCNLQRCYSTCTGSRDMVPGAFTSILNAFVIYSNLWRQAFFQTLVSSANPALW